MHTYQGSCHCGAVTFSFEGEPIDKGLRCNCSICRRKGAMMSDFTIAPEAFRYQAKDGALGLYQFGQHIARHYFCNNCGIYTFHQTFVKPGYYRVNLGCIDELDIYEFLYRVADGKEL